MPHIETWPRIPLAIRDHLAERMHDRNVSLDDLNRLRVWLETRPNVPEGRWFRFRLVETLRRGQISQDISCCWPDRYGRETIGPKARGEGPGPHCCCVVCYSAPTLVSMGPPWRAGPHQPWG
jgi:hypothetical protein